MGVLQRLGGMLVAPRRTVLEVLRGGHADALEPVVLAMLVVTSAFPVTVGRYAMVAEVSVLTALSRLVSANGFIWSRLVNEAAFCAVAAAGWFVVSLRRGRVHPFHAVTAALYLYVPMAVTVLVGALLTRGGLAWPWLPNHPMDGWWVFEGNRLHYDRVVVKWLVEMVWPLVIGLLVAWQLWIREPGPKPQP